MANPEHLEILKQSAQKWNKWREENPDVKAELSEAKLIAVNLRGADLHGADFHGAHLFGTDFSGADLSGANLSGANFSWADLSEADLNEANLQGAFLPTARNSTWEQVCKAKIDEDTRLPSDIENQHKDELEAMRENTGKEREGK